MFLDWQNNNFARASCFFTSTLFYLPLLHDYNVKVPKFTFCREREHKRMTFFFFSWTLIQSFRFNSRKICQHLMNWMSWNKCDKVWSRVNSFFKWRFHSVRCRCCLSSLTLIAKVIYRKHANRMKCTQSTSHHFF